MGFVSSERFLEIYAGVLTAALAITVFGGFAESHKTAFDEVNVHRINVVEPDGTLRLVISDKAKFRVRSSTERKLRGRTGTILGCSS